MKTMQDDLRKSALEALERFVEGTYPRKPGHDRQIEAHIMLLFGGGNAEAGRKLLAQLAIAAAKDFTS